VGTIDDCDLIKASQAGDNAAMARLINLHADAVHGFIMSMIADRSLVQDLAQETFLRALLAIKKYEFRAPFRSWLFRIAMNLCRDHLRKRKVRTIISSYQGSDRQEDREFRDPQLDALQLAVQNERNQALYRALQRLPDALRRVVVLRDLQEFSYDEIAQLLHWNLGTVKSRLFRARRELAKLMEPYLEDSYENGPSRG
jgi:RNA polymerase sigma-70 factor, ECF subfamily